MNTQALRRNQYKGFRSLRIENRARNSKPLRKVISSKSLVQGISSSEKAKSCSTGIINQQDKQIICRTKPTTKSDSIFHRNERNVCKKSEFCLDFGDSTRIPPKNVVKMNSILEMDLTEKGNSIKIVSNNSQRQKTELTIKGSNYKTVQQYYKNENFRNSSHSVHASNSVDKIKTSLSTINEHTEESLTDMSKLKDVLYEICPEPTPEEIGYFDTDSNENIKKIKEFRNKNYFECHSAKSRLSIKEGARGLSNHQCVYRFYLNDRLFPVPLNSDHQNNIRCIDCHLPVQDKKVSSSPNGTIQAKIKLGNEIQDTILMLPVKEPLIIKERRKELQTVVEPEVLYFGVIKLNSNGNSVFNSTTPSNSLALKYQKGYTEFAANVTYEYDNNDNGDIIII